MYKKFRTVNDALTAQAMVVLAVGMGLDAKAVTGFKGVPAMLAAGVGSSPLLGNSLVGIQPVKRHTEYIYHNPSIFDYWEDARSMTPFEFVTEWVNFERISPKLTRAHTLLECISSTK